MNESVDHHYLPRFYLKRWALEDRKVCRFSRPHGDKVVSKRVSPRGTAYEEHLYSMRSSDGPIADMERDFFSHLDSEAAKAMDLLEQGLPETEWKRRPRSAWSRFIWAQSIRTPSEVAQLKSSVKGPWSNSIPEWQEVYEAMRHDGAPECMNDYLAELGPYEEDLIALTTLRRCINNRGIGQTINDMRWNVLDFKDCGIPLLTSDRPVWMTPLAKPDAFILMPIGPTRLFVATRETETMLHIRSRNRRQQAKYVNKVTVQHAVNFVFGVDNKMESFVHKHFAARRRATYMERLAAKRGFSVIAKESPLS